MEVNDLNHFSPLPLEIKEIIISHLRPVDIYNLSIVDPSLGAALQSNRLKALEFSGDFRLDVALARNIFKAARLEIITHLNLNGIYWIEAGILRGLLKRLRNLESAFLLGTTMALTKSDTKVYYGLTKLSKLAVSPKTHSKSRNFTAAAFLSFFYIVNHNGHCIGASEWPFARNPGLFKTIFLTTAFSLGEHWYSIHDSDWMNEILEISWRKDRMALLERINQAKSRVQINYNLTDDVSVLEEVCNKYPDTRELSILNGKTSAVKMNKVNLKQISTMKHLRNLRLEINSGTSAFLETVFRECKNLKFLRIVSHVPQFKLSHLQLAHNLEDISFELNGSFAIDKFLLDIMENSRVKLKRVYLRFWHFGQCTFPLLNRFLLQNPQLVCFVVHCEMQEATTKQVTKVVQSHVKSAKQVFKCEKCTDRDFIVLQHLPPVHYDLVDTYCSLD